MSLRDLLVTAIVLGAVPYVLRHPFIGVLLWTWLSIMNPHKLAWGFATHAPFAAVAAIATLASLFLTKDKVKISWEPAVVLLVAFVGWTAVTTITALHSAESLVELNRVVKIQLMTLVAIAVLHQPQHLRWFIWINVLSLGFYGVKGGLFTLVTGGGNRVWGPPGGFIEGNNELALALVITIPLMYYLRLTETRKWVRHGLAIAMVLSVASVLGTHSRGALLAVAAMACFLWWRSPNKLVALVPMAVLAVAMFAFMPENWMDRMRTITSYEQDGSAMGRINAWMTMLNLANDRLLGGGFAIYTQEVYNRWAPDPSIVRAAHSIYLQVLGEHGWIGLALFMAMWLCTWSLGSRIRRATRKDPGQHQLYFLAGMCQVSLVGYAVGGAFLSLAYFDLPYNVLVILVVAERLRRESMSTASVPQRGRPGPALSATRMAPGQAR